MFCIYYLVFYTLAINYLRLFIVFKTYRCFYHNNPDVAALVDGPAPGLLWAHVRGGSEDDPGFGEVGSDRRRLYRGSTARFVRHRPPKPEVQDLDRAIRLEHDVGWLEVPMHDAGIVGGAERFSNLLAAAGLLP